MNDGLLKLERSCRRRMTRLVNVAAKGSAKDRRKVSELWTNRDQHPGKLHKPGPALPCVIIRL